MAKNAIPIRGFSFGDNRYTAARYSNRVIVTNFNNNATVTKDFATCAEARRAMNNPGSLVK